jgi:hypothetical protein
MIEFEAEAEVEGREQAAHRGAGILLYSSSCFVFISLSILIGLKVLE